MENVLIEQPKNSVLLYREVISGAWKNWDAEDVASHINQLKNSKDSSIILLNDKDLDNALRLQLRYDHQQISKALAIIEGVPFDGGIEPKKYIDPDMKPFISRVGVFRRETVKPKYNIPWLVFLGLSGLGALGYLFMSHAIL
jgi:hypothetical protein